MKATSYLLRLLACVGIPGSVTVLLAVAMSPALGQTTAISGTLTGAQAFNASSGSGTISGNATLEGTTTLSLAFGVEYLVVGGGGGGGFYNGGSFWGAGGGGAGGMLTGTTLLPSASSYSVTVGAGGLGGATNTNGGDSIFAGVTAVGGGRGANATGLSGTVGGSGGSGGGGSGYGQPGGIGTPGQGNGGGIGATAAFGAAPGDYGGGGGGAGSAGGAGIQDQGGHGGNGLPSDISGASVVYAGGGAGGYSSGTGGSGGGGSISQAGTNGRGGGGGSGAGTAGQPGGSGIVIARYLGGTFATGGAVESGTGTALGYTVHTFQTGTTSGTSTDFVLPDLDTRLAATVTATLVGSGNLDVNTPGVVTLAAANAFTGTTTVTAGTLRLDDANAIAQSEFAGGAGALTFGSVTSATFAGLSGNSSILLANADNAAVALTVGANNRSTSYSGVLSGVGGSLRKVGTGTLTIESTNTFSGNTTISDGVLKIGSFGSISNSGTIVVGDAGSTGAVLDLQASSAVSFGAIGGRGKVLGNGDGSTIVSVAGLLSPGNSPAGLTIENTLTFENTGLSLESTSNTLMEITGTGFDVVSLTRQVVDDVAGQLVYGGTLTLDFGEAFADGTTFNLFSIAGGLTDGAFAEIVAIGAYSGTFSGPSSGTYTLSSGGQTLQFSQNVPGGGDLAYGQLVVVPEPVTLGLFGIGSGAAAIGFRRLRRRTGRAGRTAAAA